MLNLAVGVSATLLVIAGCSTVQPSPSSTPPSATRSSIGPSLPPRPTPTPVTQPLAASDEGLDVAVQLSSTTVEPGGTVTVKVTITNHRSSAALIEPGYCDGMAIVSGSIPLPRDPIGRTWDGLAADYKAFALSHEHSNDTDVASVTGLPDRPGVTPFFCPPSTDSSSRLLKPGEGIEATFKLAAELVPGVPAPAGDLSFTVLVLHDPGPMPTGPCPCPRPIDQQLAVSGVITVVGSGPRLLTEGEVIDALLSDDRFAAWLPTMPSSTWSVANLGLQNIGEAQGIVPAGPSWELDLFREIGVPRNWAIGFVDPFTGKVLNLTFCNVPCAR